MGEDTWHCALSPKPRWPSADVPGRCPGSEPPWGYRGSPGTQAGSVQPIPPAWAQAEPAFPLPGGPILGPATGVPLEGYRGSLLSWRWPEHGS